jgi:hypothetical protein
VEEDGKKTWRISCQTHHIPTDVALTIVVYEYIEGVSKPILSSHVKVVHDIRSNADGLCDESGWFSGRIADADSLAWLDGGTFRIEVTRRLDGGKVLGEAVAPRWVEFGSKKRSVKGKIIFRDKVSQEFCNIVIHYANELGIDPNWLMACMAFETGMTFNPSEPNRQKSGAIGLIQFMPDTAKALGTSTAALAAMTREEQLQYVYKHFLPAKGKMHSVEDVYMQILWPAAIGLPGETVLIKASDGKKYTQNAGLDTNKDGDITKDEAAAKVLQHLEIGLKDEEKSKP